MSCPANKDLNRQIIKFVHAHWHEHTIRECCDKFAADHGLSPAAVYARYNRNNSVLKFQKLPFRRPILTDSPRYKEILRNVLR